MKFLFDVLIYALAFGICRLWIAPELSYVRALCFFSAVLFADGLRDTARDFIEAMRK